MTEISFSISPSVLDKDDLPLVDYCLRCRHKNQVRSIEMDELPRFHRTQVDVLAAMMRMWARDHRCNCCLPERLVLLIDRRERELSRCNKDTRSSGN